MSITKAAQLELMYKQMQWLQEKMETHTDNMSRSSIPAEKTHEIESFEKAVKRGANPAALAQTNASHMQGTVRKSGYSVRVAKEQPAADLTGNSISPEQQLMELNEASTRFYEIEHIHKNALERAAIAATFGGRK
jgi:hypothetical protein